MPTLLPFRLSKNLRKITTALKVWFWLFAHLVFALGEVFRARKKYASTFMAL
jgi:hypothetical protein